jgi:hypothetical protein
VCLYLHIYIGKLSRGEGFEMGLEIAENGKDSSRGQSHSNQRPRLRSLSVSG